MDNNLPTGLKAKEMPDSLDQKIDISAMVAGLTGWGALSNQKIAEGKIIKKAQFMNLERKNRLRKFIKWMMAILIKKMAKSCHISRKKSLIRLT
jgi:hypothetical protein